MLLNRFEKFRIISKDDFAEELLFKIEKSILSKQQLEDNAFPLLIDVINAFKNAGHEKEAMKLSDEAYAKLLVYGNKLSTLAGNIDYIYKALSLHINKKIKDEQSLREVYIFCC